MITEILNIIERYDLGSVVRWLLENNPSQALPYHNFNHSLWVTHHADLAYRYEMRCRPPKELIVAALFHDFGHSGGFFANDADNIKAAIGGVHDYLMQHRIADNTIVEHLITGTCFPHNTANDEHVATYYGTTGKDSAEYLQMQRALRDADMMQNCNDTMLGNFIGIKQEMFRNMKYPEYMEKTLAFLKGIKYETKYGMDIGQPRLVYAIKQLEQFQHLTLMTLFCPSDA